jgi:predicted transcriptional regulator
MFGYAVGSIKNQFKRTATAINKKFGVDILKVKKGDGKTFYIIEKSNERALTIFEETKDLYVPLNSLQLQAYEFYILLVVVVSEYGTYRGTYEHLLKYIGASVTKKNKELMDAAIKSLKEKGYLLDIDIMDDDKFTLILRTDVEKNNAVTIEMLKESKKIIEKNNKPIKYLPRLVQVWMAIQECEKHQPFTYTELEELTGLSKYQIRELKKLLENNNIFLSNRAGSYWKCLGMTVDLNAFYNN